MTRAKPTAAKAKAKPKPQPAERSGHGLFKSRPHLTASLLIGLATAGAFALIPNDLNWSTRAILSWDVTWAVFVAATLWTMRGQTPADIRQRSEKQDEGQGIILGLVLIAAAASLGAIGAELSVAKGGGFEAIARVVMVLGTVAGSWLTVQLVFALHYAHGYYAADIEHSGKDQEGLIFPGGGEPDYWDFLHFAVVIGVACQTADIGFSAKGLRRIGTLHSIVAFLFNAVVLALAINFLAGLFGAEG